MSVLNDVPAVILIDSIITNEERTIINEKGYRIIYLKNNINEEQMMQFDFPYEIDLNDEVMVIDLISNLIQKFNVMRIFTFNEYYILLAAQIAHKFNIPYWGLCLEAAENCRNKKNAKKVFKENNILSASYAIIQSPQEILSVLDHMHLPIVVKPSNDSGSHNVYICNSIQDLIDSANKIYSERNNIIGQAMDNDVIVEEFLDGPEFSVETITIGGQSEIVAITAKETLNAIEVAHTVPAILNQEDVEWIKLLVENALKVLQVDYGVTHTEIKLTTTGPKIIEVNGRLGGDNIDEIVKYVTGIDLRKTAIQISLDGNKAKKICNKKESNSATVNFLIADKNGMININISDIVLKSPLVKRMELYVENGDNVSKTTCNIDRIGYFVVTGDGEDYSREIADNLCREIEIEIV